MAFIQAIDRGSLDILYGFANSNQIFREFVKIIATGGIYLVPLFLLWLWFKKTGDNLKNKILALEVLFAGIMSWGVLNSLVKQFYFRDRPFQNSYLAVKEILAHRPDNSFPSDHASLLFAITFFLYLTKQQKLANLFLAISIIISLSRIAAGVHYASDILGGAIVGMVAALLIFGLKEKIEKYIAKPLIKLAGKFKLG